MPHDLDEMLATFAPGEPQGVVEVAPDLSLVPDRLSAQGAVNAALLSYRDGDSRKVMATSLDVIAGIFSDLARHVFTRFTLPWHKLTAAHTGWLRDQLEKRYAPKTANSRLCALRKVLRMCTKTKVNGVRLMSYEDLQDALPVQVKGSRAPAGRALSIEEIKKLFDACEDSPIGLRDRAMLACLYGLGLREREVSNLNVEKFEGTTVRVLRKGNVEQILHLTKLVAFEVDSWIKVRPGTPLGPLFVSDKNKSTRLGVSGIYDRVQKIAKHAGLKCTPHDLRRSFGTLLLDEEGGNVDIATVSKLMGHKNIATTTIYDRRGEKAQKSAIKKLPTWGDE